MVTALKVQCKELGVFSCWLGKMVFELALAPSWLLSGLC